MRTPPTFEIAWEMGTPVVWAADRAAWRAGVAREAVSRADQLVHLVRTRHRGGYDAVDAAQIMLLGQIEKLLTSALMLTDVVDSTDERIEEKIADNVFGGEWCIGTLSVTGSVVVKGVEGDPELKPAVAPPQSAR